ncbi:DNA recombination protein RmuC [Aquitalea magnusonii]|uniref:DNA recombination protein RmuC n=1 Tax=Aquitalea magnusonii TaxID=332411 RepID=A0A3G9GFI2_9NEIS|nr:DNA recombination protein RmuC [Aquitalea magnusonii]BBF85409.1 DNA recombination protein RmuC [Aquitalea magnusonii]
MIELALAILLSGGACYLLAHYRAQRMHAIQTQQWLQQEASLQARLDALQENLQSTRQRENELQQDNLSLRQQLSEAQQQTAAHWASRQEQSRQLEQLRADAQLQARHLQQQAGELIRLSGREQELQTQLQMERQQSAEKLALLSEAREALGNQFKALASDILEEKSRRFTEQNQQNIGAMLGPLHERIQGFGKLVQDTYDKDSKERLTLEQELRRLQEMNTRLNQDAIALTQALTGASNKTQGGWGEMVLEKVLETSGLSRDREYRVQVSDVLETEDGLKRYQPDVVIYLPEGKQLVVDSKVSLNAYVRHVGASDDASREQALKAHVAAIRQHIRSLSEKRYQDLYSLNTVDFVFMFIPVEPAYLLAVQHDMSLFNEAFERRIMIVGPSTLLATLRTVASIWRYEYQNQNAQEIARQSGAMYDKLAGFVGNMEKLGKQLDGARDVFGDAMRQLSTGRGNLLSSAERLRKMGIKHGKQLPAHLLTDEAEEGAER